MKKSLLISLAGVLALLVVSVFALSAFGAEAVKLKYFSPETDPTSVEIDKTIIQRFESAHPGVKVELIHGGFDDLLPMLPSMVKAGTAPDIAFFGPRYVAGLAAQGLLLPLDDLFEEIGDIPRNLISPTEDERIYDIPILMESEVLYYRKDLFEKAGLKVPSTFEEWIDVAKSLTVDLDGDGQFDRWGMAIQGKAPENAVRFTGVLWSNGGDYFDQDWNVAIESPQAIEALKTWGELAQYAPPGVPTTGNFEAATQFAQDLVAMVKYPGRILTIIDRYNPDMAPNVAVAIPPVGPSGEKPVVWSPLNDFIVFASTKHPSLAKEFIKFYLSDEQYFLFLTKSVPGHNLPVRTSWLEKKEYFEAPEIARWVGVVKESLRIAFEYGTDFHIRYPRNPYVGRAVSGPVWTGLLNSFLARQISAEEAIAEVAKAWREEFGIK
ncbi:MAG: multiple sugar transport system substrate-binding protein [Candidatus Atribacteria bacterium]|nr:multiple sugar transport system substrate-binding protein [Candidatus Atribacteria bacterium]